MNDRDYGGRYEEFVRRAMDVAYATHFRAFLEFFHSGRPGRAPRATDLTYEIATNTPPIDWTGESRRRLTDADQLAGHLSTLRNTRTSDWGSPGDWKILWPMIRRLAKDLPDSKGRLPLTFAALQRWKLDPFAAV